jgi:AAA family ATP:ADP antiporter
MNNNQFWLKILNVHSDEWKVVKNLFWLQFFQGAGISFFFTAEFARFLDKFPVYELPWVMVCSAFLLWLSGLAYTVLEHKISFKKFNSGLIILMAFSMLLVRVGSSFFPQDWFYFFSLAWFYVLYLLNNLEFWGIAARLFDIRQSKRLFGVISAGDIPAKFIGYTLALIFVPYTGTINLLIIGFICMLISLPFFHIIARTEEKSFTEGHVSKHIHHSGNSIGNLVTNFAKSRIIQRIALISLLASACMIIVNYGLYAKVKEAYRDDIELAKFIAMFMAGLRIAALITKTIITGRLTTILGVRQSLFITPGMLILLVSIILITHWSNANEKLIFYLFGATSIGVDVLRTAINSPVLLTVMQPLPTHERLRAHNIVKGIMDPFATLFCGVLLIQLYRVQQEINLVSLCYILLLLALIWIGGIVWVNKEYLNMLIKTITSRFFSQEEFTLNDPDTLYKIREKIETGTHAEVLSVLNMISTKQNPISTELLIQFLNHPSADVQLEAIRLVGTKQLYSIKDKLDVFLFNDSSPSLKKEAIKTICKLADSHTELNAYLQHPDPELRQSALSGMLGNKRTATIAEAEKLLQQLLHSSNSSDLYTALMILEDVKDEYDHPHHAVLIDSDDPVIRRKAIEAIGSAADENSLSALLRQLNGSDKTILKALYSTGYRAIPFIARYLFEEKHSMHMRRQLINLCGKIGGQEANELLIKILKDSPTDSAETIKALYRGKYISDQQLRPFMEDLSRAYLKYAVELLQMQKALLEKDQPSLLLFNAVQIELSEIREILLCLFSCLYDREQIKKVRNGLEANQKDSIANAMEIIELTVKKDIGKYFNTLYENVHIERRCNALKLLHSEINYQKTDQVLGRILSEKPISYHDWTKACSMYISKKYKLKVDTTLLDKFKDSENPMLKETAGYATA